MNKGRLYLCAEMNILAQGRHFEGVFLEWGQFSLVTISVWDVCLLDRADILLLLYSVSLLGFGQNQNVAPYLNFTCDPYFNNRLHQNTQTLGDQNLDLNLWPGSFLN